MRDTAAFAASTARPVAFAATQRISAILGTHIEQTRTPFTDYPVETKDHPNEDHLTTLTHGVLTRPLRQPRQRTLVPV